MEGISDLRAVTLVGAFQGTDYGFFLLKAIRPCKSDSSFVVKRRSLADPPTVHLLAHLRYSHPFKQESLFLRLAKFPRLGFYHADVPSRTLGCESLHPYESFFKTSLDIQSPPSVKTMSSNRKGVLALGSLSTSTLGFARQASPVVPFVNFFRSEPILIIWLPSYVYVLLNCFSC